MGLLIGHPRTRQLVDDMPVIDVFRLAKAGLIPPRATSITLTVNGVPQKVELAYRAGTTGGEFVIVRCPRCHARRWRLYIKDAALGCRGCFHLDYASHLVRGSRALARVLRLRRRLAAAPRQGKRVAALCARIAAAECQALIALDATNAGLERVNEVGNGSNGSNGSNGALTQADREEILQLRLSGVSIFQISKRHGISEKATTEVLHQQLPILSVESRAEYLRSTVGALDRLASWWASRSRESPSACALTLKIFEMRSSLLGLAQPTRIDLTVAAAGQPSESSTESLLRELDRIANEKAPAGLIEGDPPAA